MKVKEKLQAIELRKQGMAMGEIAEKVGVAKSSVSYWVRDIELTQSHRAKLNTNGHSIEAIEKRRISRLANTKARRDKIIIDAKEEAKRLIDNPTWCIGIALYWGEGGKTQNITRIANSDPVVIKTMMHFFREVCKVPEEKFHGHIHAFENCDVEKIETYWAKVANMPQSKFFKTYKKPSSASKQKRNTLPYGTFQIYIHDTNFFFRMMGWIEYIKELNHD